MGADLELPVLGFSRIFHSKSQQNRVGDFGMEGILGIVGIFQAAAGAAGAGGVGGGAPGAPGAIPGSAGGSRSSSERPPGAGKAPEGGRNPGSFIPKSGIFLPKI